MCSGKRDNLIKQYKKVRIMFISYSIHVHVHVPATHVSYMYMQLVHVHVHIQCSYAISHITMAKHPYSVPRLTSVYQLH